MSLPLSLIIALLGVICGVLGDLFAGIVENSLGHYTPFRAFAMVSAVIVVVMLAVSLEHWWTKRNISRRYGSDVDGQEKKLAALRQELYQLQNKHRERDLFWTSYYESIWLDYQREIETTKELLRDLGGVVPFDPIDHTQPPSSGHVVEAVRVLFVLPVLIGLAFLLSPVAEYAYLNRFAAPTPVVALVPTLTRTPTPLSPVAPTSPVPTATIAPTGTPSATATAAPTDAPPPSITPVPSATVAPSPSHTPTPSPTLEPSDTPTPSATATPTHTPTPTPTTTPTPGITLTPSNTPAWLITGTPFLTPTPTRPAVYPAPALIGIDVIACNVTFKWSWPLSLVENEWFDVRVAEGEPLSVAWTKARTHAFPLREPGEYVWEIAICRGLPGQYVCVDQLAVSEQLSFVFTGCPPSGPAPTTPIP